MNSNLFSEQPRRLILASASPRRADLLRLLGLEFEVMKSDLNEERETYTIPEVQVMELSQQKALRVAENVDDGLVLGADTIVVIEDQILGKPKNARCASQMLRQLSGKTHTVFTGFTIVDKPSGCMVCEYERTKVSFRELSDFEIDLYIQTGAPLDKAGSYGIQDRSAVFVDKVDGCFYNVVGFPLTRFYETFNRFTSHLNGYDK